MKSLDKKMAADGLFKQLYPRNSLRSVCDKLLSNFWLATDNVIESVIQTLRKVIWELITKSNYRYR